MREYYKHKYLTIPVIIITFATVPLFLTVFYTSSTARESETRSAGRPQQMACSGAWPAAGTSMHGLTEHDLKAPEELVHPSFAEAISLPYALVSSTCPVSGKEEKDK